jgi:hypothetical protein
MVKWHYFHEKFAQPRMGFEDKVFGNAATGKPQCWPQSIKQPKKRYL